MLLPPPLEPTLPADVCQRAVRARDPRFDGVFFVGITTTRVYCRPVCPARVTYPDRRRFFSSAAAAERAGYRPCLRCRPELAPGRAICDAVSRLAQAAAHRIGAGALNGSSVAELAKDLGVSERHLRRCLERELGVSPIELAQTHRLLLAKRLLADTDLPVTRIAFASGFQSLRRFNALFRERYRIPPSAVRRARRPLRPGEMSRSDRLRLALAYRPPLHWTALLDELRRDAIAGLELVDGRSYARTVRLQERAGVLVAADAGEGHIDIEVSASLVPSLMPLLARVRHLFDLDAEPSVIDAHLAQDGLGSLVRQRPGLRIPGAVDGFEIALATLARGRVGWRSELPDPAEQIVQGLGDRLETGEPALNRLSPTAERVVAAGSAQLIALGVPPRRARAIEEVGRLVLKGELRLEPGCDAPVIHRRLMQIEGVGDRLATHIVRRALYWPDAFSSEDPALQAAAGVSTGVALLARAEPWRPWRAYAVMHLRGPHE
jgi:AraC family transcriptional regulator of adaptative response / DNA-3-methyladenine glycosylase II